MQLPARHDAGRGAVELPRRGCRHLDSAGAPSRARRGRAFAGPGAGAGAGRRRPVRRRVLPADRLAGRSPCGSGSSACSCGRARPSQRLQGQLGPTGVELCDWSELDDDDRQAVTAVFRDRILPVLVPLVVEAGKRLPPPANLSLNVAVTSATPGSAFGSVELPPVVPRFVRVRPRPGSGVQVVPVEQVVMANLALLFPGEEISGLRRLPGHPAGRCRGRPRGRRHADVGGASAPPRAPWPRRPPRGRHVHPRRDPGAPHG